MFSLSDNGAASPMVETDRSEIGVENEELVFVETTPSVEQGPFSAYSYDNRCVPYSCYELKPSLSQMVPPLTTQW